MEQLEKTSDCELKKEILALMEQVRYEDAEEKIQEALMYDDRDHYFLLMTLGLLYKKEAKLLEANDAYIRAKKKAETEEQVRECQKELDDMQVQLKEANFCEAEKAKSLYKVVSIYCYGRSGTHFFKSLLDGHPQLMQSMLSGMKIFGLWEHIVTNDGESFVKEHVDETIDMIFETFIDYFNEGKEYEEAIMNGMCSMGEDRTSIFTIDRVRFAEKYTSIIKSATEVTKRFFYQAIQYAATYGIGYEYDFTKGIPVIVEGGIHFSKSTDPTNELLNEFPYTRLLHMVRKPTIAFASSLQYIIKSGQANVDNLSANVIAIFANIPMKEEWASRTRLIKLEDLHTASKEVLQGFCDFIDVDWSETLLDSTFGGIKWWNTKTSAVISGFNTKTISNNYEELLSSFDRFRMDLLLHTKFKVWGYDTFDFDRVELVEALYKEPFKFESYFGKTKMDFMVMRRIMNKLLEKQIEEEKKIPFNERIELKGLLIQPKGEE